MVTVGMTWRRMVVGSRTRWWGTEAVEWFSGRGRQALMGHADALGIPLTFTHSRGRGTRLFVPTELVRTVTLDVLLGRRGGWHVYSRVEENG